MVVCVVVWSADFIDQVVLVKFFVVIGGRAVYCFDVLVLEGDAFVVYLICGGAEVVGIVCCSIVVCRVY